METIKVDKKDIATVIGKGGATIREIVETSGAKVDVKDTGDVTIAAPDEASRNKAIDFIKNLIAKPKVGDVVKEGDEVSVKVVGFDRGKVKLSMKQASA